MASLLFHGVEDPRPCSYLPRETAQLEYQFLTDVTVEEYESLLVRGWRRFGLAYFRPACTACQACVSLRVPVATFVPSRSQKRAEKKALRAEVGPVRVDDARLALYASWHSAREDARGWGPMPLTRRDYMRDFAMPHPCAREVAYYDDRAGAPPRLVGVGLCDVTPSAWSAIYFYYDPAYASHSPGVGHILNLIRLAERHGQSHVYLGFRVSDCASMRYKAQFRPHELLETRPGPDETPLWR